MKNHSFFLCFQVTATRTLKLSKFVFLAGTYVIQLQANDIDEGINAEVTYSLASTNQSDWFMINRDSGLITTR